MKNIAFHPTEPNTFFVCIEQGGLMKTSDSGQTWTELFAWQQDVGAGAALVDTQARAMAPRQFIGKTVDLQQVERMTAHEVNFLQQHTQGQAFKVTMPGDGHFAGNAFKAGITDQVYRTRLDMARDIGMVQRREIEALIAQGVPYIQLDSLRYVIQLADPERREAIKAAGINPETDLDDTIKVGTNLLAAV